MKQRSQQSNHRLKAHTVAIQAAVTVLPLAAKISAPMKPIADQLIRSVSSVPLNLAEGNGRSGRDRFNHWRIAYGSALEASSAMQLLVAAAAPAPARWILTLYLSLSAVSDPDSCRRP